MTRVALTFSTGESVANPADDTETVIAILAGVTCQFAGDTFKIHGYVNVDLDDDAVDAVLRVRRTSIAGDQVGEEASILSSVTAGGNGVTNSLDVIDTPGDVANAVYVLTLECTTASGPSVVNDCSLSARCD